MRLRLRLPSKKGGSYRLRLPSPEFLVNDILDFDCWCCVIVFCLIVIIEMTTFKNTILLNFDKRLTKNKLSLGSDNRRFSSGSSYGGGSMSQRTSSMDESPFGDPNRRSFDSHQQPHNHDSRRSADNASRMEFPRWENPRMRNPSSDYDRCSPLEDPHAPSNNHDTRNTSFDGSRTRHQSHPNRSTEFRLEDPRMKHPSYENIRRPDDHPPIDPRLEDPRRNLAGHRGPGADNFLNCQVNNALESNKTVEFAKGDDECLIIEPGKCAKIEILYYLYFLYKTDDKVPSYP